MHSEDISYAETTSQGTFMTYGNQKEQELKQ